MKALIAISLNLLLISAVAANGSENLKQEALATLKAFLSLNQRHIQLSGQYQNSDPAFGSRCQIHIDFSTAGQEYLTLSGDFSPANTLGEGVFFNAPSQSFTQLDWDKGQWTVTQSFEDSFATGSSTTLVLTKSPGQLVLKLQQSNRFLLFSDTQEKRCVVPFN